MAEEKTPYELAKDYYPKLWDRKRIDAIYEKGLLTEDEYNSIINKNTNT